MRLGIFLCWTDIDDCHQAVPCPIKQFARRHWLQGIAAAQVTGNQVPHLIKMGLGKYPKIADGIERAVIRELITDMFTIAMRFDQTSGLEMLQVFRGIRHGKTRNLGQFVNVSFALGQKIEQFQTHRTT